MTCIAIDNYVFASVSIYLFYLFFSHLILNFHKMWAITSAALQLLDPNSVITQSSMERYPNPNSNPNPTPAMCFTLQI